MTLCPRLFRTKEARRIPRLCMQRISAEVAKSTRHLSRSGGFTYPEMAWHHPRTWVSVARVSQNQGLISTHGQRGKVRAGIRGQHSEELGVLLMACWHVAWSLHCGTDTALFFVILHKLKSQLFPYFATSATDVPGNHPQLLNARNGPAIALAAPKPVANP